MTRRTRASRPPPTLLVPYCTLLCPTVPVQPTMMDKIARVVGAKILPSVDHITRIAAAAAAGKDGVATAGREEVQIVN